MSLLKSGDGTVAQAPHHRHQSVKVLQLQKFLMRQTVRDEMSCVVLVEKIPVKMAL